MSWISALKDQNLLAPLTFEGCCNRDLFEAWLKNCLIPQLEPGDLIIIDNAIFITESISKKLLKRLDAKFGICLHIHAYLNKIENWWAVREDMDETEIKGI